MEPSGTRPVRALVLEGEGLPALAAVRSLGRAGHEVDVVATGPGAPSFASRYCRRRFVEPSIRAADAWRAFLIERLKAERYDALLLGGDSSAERVGPHRHLFDPLVPMLLPDPESFRVALDKTLTLGLAERLGVPIPRTLFPADIEELRRCAGDLEYPQVVKGPGGSGADRVRFASTPAQLLERFSEVARLGEPDGHSPPMVQERMRGESVCYAGLFRDGRPLAEFMWRRLLGYPITGGPTASGESVRDDGVRAQCRKLCEALRWTGIAEIEFMRDPRDGVPKLMEINPRFWGPMEFAIRCGVDFPRLYVEACLGRPFEPVLDYPVGRRLSFLSPRILIAATTPEQRLPLLRDLLRPDRFDADWRDLTPTLRQLRGTWWDYRGLRRVESAARPADP